MDDIPVCWRCGTRLEKLSLPLSRLDECPQCEVQVHVCRMCVSFDPSVTRSCTEDDAEDVRDKERANYCDFFKPRTDAFDAAYAAADRKASEQLDQLFGEGQNDGPTGDTGNQAAGDLFK
jgi:hypothetical protein